MHDIVIAGAGPAGLSAGIYGARAGLDVLIVERLFAGGQIANTKILENYPGLDPIDGPNFAFKLGEQAKKAGAKIIYDQITDFSLEGNEKTIQGAKRAYQGKTVILSMGAYPRGLGILAEQKFSSRGLSYCATCDGSLYRDKTVAVAGGGDTAVEDALYLANLAKKVYIIHRRDQFRAQATLQQLLSANGVIEQVLNSTVVDLAGGEFLEKVIVEDKNTSKRREIPADALFIAIGRIPDTEALPYARMKDEQGYLLTDETMKTYIPGVYAAGDIRKKQLRQVVTAAADGALAASMAAQYILSLS
ncbi:MAG: NAD(P)/FAD-dependent oxidoreductase [Christensenellales bacterium]